MYLRKGWDELALDHFKTAIRLNPNYPEAYLNLGNTYLRKKMYEKALAHYNKALSVNPDYEKAKLNIEAIAQIRKYGDRPIELVY